MEVPPNPPLDIVAIDPNNGRDPESSVSVPKWLQRDEPVALWVKWRGKWQAGIRCARADWPLTALKAKPTDDRNTYIVIFFPHTKNYSWADMMLVRAIGEFPQPNAYKTQEIGQQVVKDLSVANRCIMKRVAVGIMNVADRLHRGALVDTARDVTDWKKMAMEAASSGSYSDLGRMLLQLQNMIVPRYINSNWRLQLFPSWAQQCHVARSAESVELLKEELDESILWTEVNSLSNVPLNPTLVSRGENSSSAAQTVAIVADIVRKRCRSPSSSSLSASQKRPKLDIRRLEPNPSEVEMINLLQPITIENVVPHTKNRKCIAFIQAKGRQCDRWANDGESYCCIHLTTRFTPRKPEPIRSVDSPICGGTTIFGKQCKHRSLPGSSFCKKHGPRADNPGAEPSICKDIVLFQQVVTPLHCIGSSPLGSGLPCREIPSFYSLYCKNHKPKWLRRSRFGKSRIIPKEVFIDLLQGCFSLNQKLCLHKACDVFYNLFKSVMLQNPDEMDVQLQWAFSECFKDSGVGELFYKLVSTEKERLAEIWGFTFPENDQNVTGNSLQPPKGGIDDNSYIFKTGRVSRPGFRNGLRAAKYKIQRGNPNSKRLILAPQPINAIPKPQAVGGLEEPGHFSVATTLYEKMQKAKPQPNNIEILAAAKAACCKLSLKATLERKYGDLPERFYLKAAKICSESNTRVQWHQEGFICPKGCRSVEDQGLNLTFPAVPRSNRSVAIKLGNLSENGNNEWEMDECHYVIGLPDFRETPQGKVTVLYKDISFGKEAIAIACVVDEDVLGGQTFDVSGLWDNFKYISRPLLDQHHDTDIKGFQLRCVCPNSLCLPERCNHVYLFDNDFEDAIDIYGKPMHGRFPYDDHGRLILEEGYLVYECNCLCSCGKTCRNRVLQNGLRVKLEVFKTKKKGWGVRALEPILRGTFVCEYIGEILDEQEANERRKRYGEQRCSYMFSVDAHANDIGRIFRGGENYVIDATKYGNISRFINHSCKPNLLTHQVIIDSMESQNARLGLYAKQDIMPGEELTLDYRYNMGPGGGFSCHCETIKCRSRLH